VTGEAPEKLALDVKAVVGRETVDLPGTAIGDGSPSVVLRADVGDIAVRSVKTKRRPRSLRTGGVFVRRAFLAHGNVGNAGFFIRFSVGGKPQLFVETPGVQLGVQVNLLRAGGERFLRQAAHHFGTETGAAAFTQHGDPPEEHGTAPDDA